MSERIGIREACRLADMPKNPTALYVAYARGFLKKVDVIDHELRFDPDEVVLWRKNVLKAENARLREFERREREKAARINRRR